MADPRIPTVCTKLADGSVGVATQTNDGDVEVTYLVISWRELLGLATMFLSRYIMPDRISKVLGVVSGLTSVWIGAMMLWRQRGPK